MLPHPTAGPNAFSAQRGTVMPPNLRDDQSDGSTLKMGSSDNGSIAEMFETKKRAVYQKNMEYSMHCE
jgi:hypothetical protein